MKSIIYRIVGLIALFCMSSECTAEGIASGYVENKEHTRVTGAFVSVVKDGTMADSCITDKNGEYRIQRLTAGTYTIRVKAEGYALRIVPDVVVAEHDNHIVNISDLAPEGRISGTVKRANGTLISKALVTVDCGIGEHFLEFTDADGFYIIKNLLKATYTVTVHDPNFGFAPVSGVNVVPGAANPNVNFTGYNGIITGKITKSDGITPIEKVLVSAYGNSDHALVTAFSDSNGNYKLKYLSTGSYKVKVQTRTATIASADHVAVIDGQVTDKDFSAEEGAISGTVKNESQMAIAGARLIVATKTGGCIAISDSRGHYKIENLPAGTYTVTVDPNSNDCSAAKIDHVIVRNNTETQKINFTLFSPAGKITGRVINSSGTPIQRASVTAVDASPNSLTDPSAAASGARTDANGNYTLNYLRRGSSYLVSVTANGYVGQGEPNVVVIAGQTTANINIVLQPSASGGKISGTVYKPDGLTPLAGAGVFCMSLETFSSAQALTASDGTYTLDSLGPGTYKVHAYVSGYKLKTIMGVTVTSGSENRGNNFTLELE